MLFLLGVSAYQVMKPEINLPIPGISLPEIKIELPKPEIPEVVLDFFQKDPTPIVAVLLTTSEPFATPEAADVNTPVYTTRTSMPMPPTREPTITPTSTVIVSLLEFAPQDLCSPVEGIEMYELEDIISQLYNVPNQFSDFGHHGVDFGSYNFRDRYLYAVPVKAMLAGRVVGIVRDRPPLGNVIILETPYEDLPASIADLIDIQPGESLYHLYAHLLDDPDYDFGTFFNCGDPINRLGDSQTSEAHLHLETRIGQSGLTVESMAFYDTTATEDEQEEYLWWRTSGDLEPFDPMIIFLNFRYQ